MKWAVSSCCCCELTAVLLTCESSLTFITCRSGGIAVKRSRAQSAGWSREVWRAVDCLSLTSSLSAPLLWCKFWLTPIYIETDVAQPTYNTPIITNKAADKCKRVSLWTDHNIFYFYFYFLAQVMPSTTNSPHNICSAVVSKHVN